MDRRIHNNQENKPRTKVTTNHDVIAETFSPEFNFFFSAIKKLDKKSSTTPKGDGRNLSRIMAIIKLINNTLGLLS